MARITTSPLFVRRPPLGMLRLRRLMVPPLVVADTAHGAVVGDFVTFSGATSLGGVITAAVLNQEYEITLVVNANSYQIVSRDRGHYPYSTNLGRYKHNSSHNKKRGSCSC